MNKLKTKNKAKKQSCLNQKGKKKRIGIVQKEKKSSKLKSKPLSRLKTLPSKQKNEGKQTEKHGKGKQKTFYGSPASKE